MAFNKLYLNAALAFIACGVIPAEAQLHESINVEGKYVPEIIRIDRINTFPKAAKFSLGATPLNYESGGVAASFTPSLMTMPATGWRDTRYVSDTPGYLEFGVGSWLNSTLSAGYRFIDNSTTLAGIRLQHNSTSLWEPKLSDATIGVKQYRYDESIGAYASHVVKGYGRLDASLDYHVGLFNYYGIFNPNALPDTRLDAPSQTLNDFSLRLDWSSLIRPSSNLAYHAMARVRHFAYRAMPLPVEWGKGNAKGNRETNVEFAGGVRMPWDKGNSIGLDADLNMLVYGGQENIFSYAQAGGMREYSLNRPNNYGLLTLTPYYRFNKDLIEVRLGADIDLAFNAGPEGNRYSFFHVAPDVRFALQTGQLGMYLNVLGGSNLNTLANLYQHDYYMMPALASTRPTYTPIDATLGINLGPFSGFSIGVEGSFRSSKNVPLGGWYQAWMNYGGAPIPGINEAAELTRYDRMLYSLDADGINLHGVSVGGYISFEPSDKFSFKAQGSIQPQDGEKGYFNGYDRPKVTMNVDATVKPMDQLSLSAGFDYRAKRCIYTRAISDLPNGGVTPDKADGTLCSMNLPDMALLNLGASWDFSKSFTVWLQADNLLNRHDEMLPMLPAQGISVAAGLKVLF